MSLEIRRAQLGDRTDWNAFVAGNPAATPYHRFEWTEAVGVAYRHWAYRLIARREGRVVGILPLVHMKPPVRAGKLVSLPFCDMGGVVCETAGVERQLVQEALALGRELEVRAVELRTQGVLAPSPEGYGTATQSHKVRMMLELPASAEELLASFKSKLRSQVRKSERNGVEFRWGTQGDLQEFYGVFCRNMRDLGSPVHARVWFESVVTRYGENAALGLVSHGGQCIGGGILLFNGDQVSLPWASTLRTHNHLAPNMLLYWRLLEAACERGCRCFDFGRSSPGEGTYKFKAQWGARPQPLYWSSLIRSAEDETLVPSGPSRLRQSIAEAWQRLPLPVANLLGPHLRRHVSL